MNNKLNGFNNGKDLSDGVGGLPANLETANGLRYDWLIIGAGLGGAVFAHEMTKIGKTCLIIDRRKTIGGNCYTEIKENIPVHVWGAHIFHTNSQKVWDWVNQFVKFKKYHHSVKCSYDNKLYTFPINLKTLHEIDPTITSPAQAEAYFEQFKNLTSLEGYGDLSEDNLQNHCIKQIGPVLYELFIRGYTSKQWGRDPKELPSRIIKRIPVRTNFDDTYFHNAQYEGIPENGYTQIFEKCLSGITVLNGIEYLDNQADYDSMAKNILYTGALDEYFNWDLGELEWRSLKFDIQTVDVKDFQGSSIINYNKEDVPYTRIIEHKHFVGAQSDKTVISYEYPADWKRKDEPFYPIADDKNNELHKKYKEKFAQTGKYCTGRLADYKYYDMDQVIASSLSLFEKLKTL